MNIYTRSLKRQYGSNHIVPDIIFWNKKMLIHIVYLVNFDQSLSKSHIVQSMLNFAMFLANSDQEIIQAIRFDPYYPYKVFTKFHFLFQMDLRN